MDEAFTSGTINNGNEIEYGFAWETGEYNDDWYVGHSGYWLAFDSYFLRFPDDELSIIVLYNWDYADPDYGGRVVLVLGSEGRGLRPRGAASCDQRIALPVRGRVGSLNVAAATAALVYGILHLRGLRVDRAP